MATRISMLKFRNIDMTRVEGSGQAGLELRRRARELGRELRLEKEGTGDITESFLAISRVN